MPRVLSKASQQDTTSCECVTAFQKVGHLFETEEKAEKHCELQHKGFYESDDGLFYCTIEHPVAEPGVAPSAECEEICGPVVHGFLRLDSAIETCLAGEPCADVDDWSVAPDDMLLLAEDVSAADCCSDFY